MDTQSKKDYLLTEGSGIEMDVIKYIVKNVPNDITNYDIFIKELYDNVAYSSPQILYKNTLYICQRYLGKYQEKWNTDIIDYTKTLR